MKKLLLVFICLILPCAIMAQSKKQWGNIALNDAYGLYQDYRDYHAGIVDPQDFAFYDNLYKSYKKYSRKAHKVRSEKKYQKVLNDFVASFNNGEARIVFDKDLSVPKKTKDLKTLRRPLSLESFEGGNAWIYLNTFEGSPYLPESFAQQLEAAKNSNSIVLDLRYNNIGSQDNADLVLEALFGKEFAQNNKNEVFANQQRYLRIPDSDKKPLSLSFPPDEAAYRETLEEGKNIFFYPQTPLPYTEGLKPGLKAKVYVLTDETCLGACLYFMDLAKNIDGVTHIGKETGSDTKHTEFITFKLTSRKGKIDIPVAGILNRPRKDNQTYKPDLKYKKDIDKTDDIKNWVLTLQN